MLCPNVAPGATELSSYRPAVNLRSRYIFSALLLLFLCLVHSWDRAFAQGTQSGEIRGIVSDQSNALVPGVQVTIRNVDTGTSQALLTNDRGLYDAPYVAPGHYSITFRKDGFETYQRDNITLNLGAITVNATLHIGSNSQTVTVTETQSLLQTESSDKSTTLSSEVISETPSINRQWYDLLAAMPGVNPGGGEQASGQGIGVNGQQSYNSAWRIDGGMAMLGQSSNPDSIAPPLEDIEEVGLSTANFGAEHGSGLSTFNVITKSGTNEFHGSIYEYIENDAANALNEFALSKVPLRWNEYGFTLGGPIKRNRAFFFVGYQRNPINGASPSYASYPTDAYRSGDFSALLGDPALDDNNNAIINPCNGEPVLNGQIYDPATTRVVNGQTCRLPFPGNIIPNTRFDPVAARIQQYFPEPNLNGLSQNFYSSLTSPVVNSWTNAKVDYDITPSNRLTGSLLIAKWSNVFNTSIPAINNSSWNGNEPQGQITDVWTINKDLVNEFRYAISREHGVATIVNQDQGWPTKLGLKNPAGDLFPSISIEGVMSTSIGYTDFPPAVDAETTFDPSDVMTLIKGKHVLKFGGEFTRWWVNTGWGTATEGGFDFSGVFTQNPVDQAIENGPIPTEGEGYADFLLGGPDWWGVSINPETGGRMWSIQSFAQDAFKMRPNLTLTYGLRYVVQSGWSEVQNRISSFEPNIMNPATGTPGALWYAGQLGHRSLTDTVPDFFAPRVGFAWAFQPNSTLRGGFGVYTIIASQNVLGPAQAWGQGWSPAGALYDTDDPVFQLSDGPPDGATIYPTAATRTPDLLNGTSVNYSLWHTPLEYSEEYQLDLQHEFRYGVVLDIGYVGNRDPRLQFGRDINQVPAGKLGQGQLARPYPQYLDVNAALFDGHSNYNALQVSVRKQATQGLLFAVNYAWSKSLDSITSAGWGGSGANDRAGYQDANDPAANYGRSASDIRQMVNGNVVYHLPFGQGMRFASNSNLLNGVVGGWELSSIYLFRSGLPFAPLVGTNNSGAMSGSWFPNLAGNPFQGTCPNGARVKTVSCWFNPAAFATPPANTFGNLHRNVYSGPDWANIDLSLIRNISLHSLREGASLQIKVAATDIFNHPNIGLPDAVLGDGGFSQILYANTSRMMQLGAKLSF